MVNCPRCRHPNPDRATVCGLCAGDLFAFAAIVLSAPLPAPMVEPIDTPQKPPPDSKPLPARLAQTFSFNENSEGSPQHLDPECNEIDFSPQTVVDSPTMSSEQSSRYVVHAIHDYPKIDDGIRGMAFIEAVVASSKANAAWTKLDI